MAPSQSLLIVGAGSLGSRVGLVWHDRGYDVLAETRSRQRHPALANTGLVVRLRDDPPPQPQPFVLFSVPPSAAPEQYRGETKRAVDLWDRTGQLVAISSTAVYAEDAGGTCIEHSPLASTERARRLLASETVVLDAGGIVIRMAGLYDFWRGPHRVFFRKDESPRRPDGLLNLIHYDDAAALCLAAFERGEPGTTYLGCDNQPITRRTLVEASAAAPLYAGSKPCTFTATDGPLGRRCDNSWTRDELRWRPRFPAFQHWIGGEEIAKEGGWQ